jgi:hypothetical protein
MGEVRVSHMSTRPLSMRATNRCCCACAPACRCVGQIAPRRTRAALRHPEVDLIVCDDGLQHLRLAAMCR